MRTAERAMGKVLRRASQMLTKNGGGGREWGLNLYADSQNLDLELYEDKHD